MELVWELGARSLASSPPPGQRVPGDRTAHAAQGMGTSCVLERRGGRLGKDCSVSGLTGAVYWKDHRPQLSPRSLHSSKPHFFSGSQGSVCGDPSDLLRIPGKSRFLLVATQVAVPLSKSGGWCCNGDRAHSRPSLEQICFPVNPLVSGTL